MNVLFPKGVDVLSMDKVPLRPVWRMASLLLGPIRRTEERHSAMAFCVRTAGCALLLPMLTASLLLPMRLTAFGPHPRSGTEAFPYLVSSDYARPQGLASAYTALAEGTDAIGSNPAGLAKIGEGYSLTSGYQNWILGGNHGVLNAARPYGKIRYGLSLTYRDEGNFEVVDLVDGEKVETGQIVRPFAMNTGFSAAASVLPSLNVGATLNLPVEYLGGFYQSQWAMGWGMDAGVQYQPNSRLFTFGASVLNLGRQERAHLEEGRTGDLLPLEGRLGMVYHGLARGKGRLVVDLHDPYHDYLYAAVGAEYDFSDAFRVRIGSQANRKEAEYYFRTIALGDDLEDLETRRLAKLTGGFTLRYQKLVVEYAGQYWTGLGLLHFVTLKYHYSV